MKVKTLGDVHLGKQFKNGVPLDRRGDREAMQWAQFERELNDVDGVDLHIQMGDLFDQAVVPYGVIYRAAQIYKAATKANPQTKYALLRGNHDANRDVEKVTAFMLFTAIVGDAVTVAADRPVRFGGHVLIPWHPVTTAREMVAMYDDVIENSSAVYGHWDVVAIGEGALDNLLPAAELKALNVGRAFTGHDHNARELEIADLPVTVTGSMQPYSHSEDPEERFYVTRSLDDVLAAPDAFHDKHLRVRLVANEVIEVPIDCLSLTVVREGAGDDEEVNIDVEFDPFDMRALFETAAADLSEPMREVVWAKMQEGRMGEE